MRITKLRRVRGFRLLRDFAWPPDLHEFAQFNLIYGWNGCGKTTVSTLLRHIQSRTPLESGEVDVDIDGRTVRSDTFSTATLPAVRVFNRDFVAESVFESGNPIAPIFYFGSDSVAKQRTVEGLNEQLRANETTQLEAIAALKTATRAVDDFLTGNAKSIKEQLISGRSTSYNNYDRKVLQKALERLTADAAERARVNDSEKVRLRKQKDATPKDSMQLIRVPTRDCATIARQAAYLLERSVVSQVLAELSSDRQLGSWLQEGLRLHTKERASSLCRFCAQPLPSARLRAIEGHFNDSFASALKEVEAAEASINADMAALSQVKIPDSSRLYDHLIGEYDRAAGALLAEISRVHAFLGTVKDALASKKQALHETASISLSPTPSAAELEAATEAVNQFLIQHNTQTAAFQDSVMQACKLLESSLVAELHPSFLLLGASLEAARQRVAHHEAAASKLRSEIAELEKDLHEHRRPAEELNADLAAYLGRRELRIEVRENGYSIYRGTVPAQHLSEGERTAIAVLYFLKSLQDRAFDLPNGVVVIDDPVSSLDSNAVFAAFGFIKERTKSAGQLILLTHNFAFFRLVKNWFHHLPLQNKKDLARRPARFFLLQSSITELGRVARISQLDQLLEKYESEYHYLFQTVLKEANRATPAGSLETLYGMPNLARRLLEAFLAFRLPDLSCELYQALEQVDYDAAAKTRILRFLNTFSHHGAIPDLNHDPSALSESRDVLREVLEMMKHLDLDHYERMVRVATA